MTSASRAGHLVLSLDFELYWGVRDKAAVAQYEPNLRGAREVVPRMLELFGDRDVRATWATVGALFFDSREALLAGLPSDRPTYDDERLSPYPDLMRVGSDESQDPLRLGASLVRRIADTPGQDLGTHTFSHYYCLEPGQQLHQFAADLDAAVAAAGRLGAELRSIVFPRNQVNDAFLGCCADRGLVAYRGAQAGWMHSSRAASSETVTRRAARLVDAHLPVVRRTSYERPLPSHHGLVNVPASRFFRPRAAGRPLVLSRIEREMTAAAREGLVYHLWWHPHNFGVDQDGHLADLRRVLTRFDELQAQYGMRSSSMRDLAQEA